MGAKALLQADIAALAVLLNLLVDTAPAALRLAVLTAQALQAPVRRGHLVAAPTLLRPQLQAALLPLQTRTAPQAPLHPLPQQAAQTLTVALPQPLRPQRHQVLTLRLQRLQSLPLLLLSHPLPLQHSHPSPHLPMAPRTVALVPTALAGDLVARHTVEAEEGAEALLLGATRLSAALLTAEAETLPLVVLPPQVVPHPAEVETLPLVALLLRVAHRTAAADPLVVTLPRRAAILLRQAAALRRQVALLTVVAALLVATRLLQPVAHLHQEARLTAAVDPLAATLQLPVVAHPLLAVRHTAVADLLAAAPLRQAATRQVPVAQ